MSNNLTHIEYGDTIEKVFSKVNKGFEKTDADDKRLDEVDKTVLNARSNSVTGVTHETLADRLNADSQLIKDLGEKQQGDVDSMERYIDDKNQVTNTRIDNIVSVNNPTEGNSELIDIRMGNTGRVYSSAGEAVREQVKAGITHFGTALSSRSLNEVSDIINTVYIMSSGQTYTDVPIDSHGKPVLIGWLITESTGANIISQKVIQFTTGLKFFRHTLVNSNPVKWIDWIDESTLGEINTHLNVYTQKMLNSYVYKIMKLNLVDNIIPGKDNGYYNQGKWVDNPGFKPIMIPYTYTANKYFILPSYLFVQFYLKGKYVGEAVHSQIECEITPGVKQTYHLFTVPDDIGEFDTIGTTTKIPETSELVSTPFPTRTWFFLQEDKEDEIVVDMDGNIINKSETYTITSSDLFEGIVTMWGNKVLHSVDPTTVNEHWSSTNKQCFFKKGSVLDTKYTPICFDIRGMTKDKLFFISMADNTQYHVFEEDTYCIVTICDNAKAVNWPDDKPNIGIVDNASFLRILVAEDRRKNQWKGKTWWAYGTSITDIGLEDTVGNNGHSGKYPLSLTALSEMNRHNGAIGSGGILDDKPDNLNYRLNILKTPYDTDLVTIETLPNDGYVSKLGEIGDTLPSTIIGALTECFEYLTTQTRAKIVLLIVTGSIHDMNSATPDVNFKPYESGRLNWKKAVDKITELAHLYGVTVINADENALAWGQRKTGITYRDHIHLNYLGGEIFGKYIWEELKKIQPNFSYPKPTK